MLKATKWTAYRLYVNSGVSEGTISRILAGITDPKNSTMEKLRQAVSKELASRPKKKGKK